MLIEGAASGFAAAGGGAFWPRFFSTSGISTGTVDRALHAKPGVSVMTRARVLSMAESLGYRLGRLLTNRLRIEAWCRDHPEIEAEQVEGPIFIIGLPRTGTTALSHLLTADPQIRSLRVWESGDPVPPPEAATRDTDPRIAQAQAGLDLMDQAFPKMKMLYFQTATGATECQDLLGMEFRTSHFDGMAHVPSYTDWVIDCDMLPAYRYHRRTLQLLQSRCPPRLTVDWATVASPS